MLDEILYLNPSRQPNNIGVNGYGTEADNMMIVAKRVKGKLDMMGIIKKIVLTEGLTLSQAIAESNAVGATLHLDMHSDADGDDNSKTGFGCTGIYKSDKGKQFISCIYKHVSALTPTYDRGLSYRTDLGALNQTRAVAALIECFFHDNASDVAFYEAHVDAFARAIVDGILEYLGVNNISVAAASAPQVPASAQLSENVIELQKLCTSLGIKDFEGKALAVDGLRGRRTLYCVSLLPLCGVKYTQRAATRYIQARLNKWLYKDANGLTLSVDGIFGTKTADALKKFQKDNSLTADGVCGANTWKTFYKW